jgi:hypothetical protein
MLEIRVHLPSLSTGGGPGFRTGSLKILQRLHEVPIRRKPLAPLIQSLIQGQSGCYNLRLARRLRIGKLGLRMAVGPFVFAALPEVVSLPPDRARICHPRDINQGR